MIQLIIFAEGQRIFRQNPLHRILRCCEHHGFRSTVDETDGDRLRGNVFSRMRFFAVRRNIYAFIGMGCGRICSVKNGNTE